ncbi:MAG: hypothetical protein GVY02_01475 [Bacteroidetes bacterium]|jgi:hypothetical protein|nr:hypothetical protein [Bacteroidota bacterium]
MKRQKLQELIIDAADGLLSKHQLQELQSSLDRYPDLREEYELLMSTPSPSEAYGESVNQQAMLASMRQLKNSIRSIKSRDSFEQISVAWFWRGALAASLALFALTGILSYSQAVGVGDTAYEPIVEENFYIVEESIGETYQMYLDELSTEE